MDEQSGQPLIDELAEFCARVLGRGDAAMQAAEEARGRAAGDDRVQLLAAAAAACRAREVEPRPPKPLPPRAPAPAPGETPPPPRPTPPPRAPQAAPGARSRMDWRRRWPASLRRPPPGSR